MFVETKLFAKAPSGPYTRIEVIDRTTTVEIESENLHENIQECYTSITLYVVTRSWSDGGNPSFTPVSRVGILIAPGTAAPEIFVRIELEDGRDTEVTLSEEGGVIFVDTQQGEVAELVMTLAESKALSDFEYIKSKPLRHRPRET
ncbi:hypothetical protein diail_3765 [Diaporthe ilicicola]|nr:hypothetical protein diail_3765 [Diaporthe ilicicola]